MSNIIEIAHLVEFLIRGDVTNKQKAIAVKETLADGVITADEALDLIIEYT